MLQDAEKQGDCLDLSKMRHCCMNLAALAKLD